jgi:hypothetical protein
LAMRRISLSGEVNFDNFPFITLEIRIRYITENKSKSKSPTNEAFNIRRV